jgi:hypothetical protein
MLFIHEDQLIDVLCEVSYEGILTVCGDDRKTLAALDPSGFSKPIRLSGHYFGWAIHLPIDCAPDWLNWKLHKDIEKVDRLTGPAKAYFYSYVKESAVDENGVQWGDYGYCWPEDLERNKQWLLEGEDPALGEVYFVPLWYVPQELRDENKNQFRKDSQ